MFGLKIEYNQLNQIHQIESKPRAVKIAKITNFLKIDRKPDLFRNLQRNFSGDLILLSGMQPIEITRLAQRNVLIGDNYYF